MYFYLLNLATLVILTKLSLLAKSDFNYAFFIIKVTQIWGGRTIILLS